MVMMVMTMKSPERRLSAAGTRPSSNQWTLVWCMDGEAVLLSLPLQDTPKKV
jgi:hypothetical protein